MDPMTNSTLDAQKLMHHLPMMPYQEVADIGAGAGRIAIPMAKFLHDGKVVAIDLDKDKIAALKEAVKETNLTNVEAKSVGEGKRLPLKNDSVDGVVLSMVLHHADDPKFILSEARRILKTAGWLAVLELHKREDVEGHPLEERLDETDAKAMLLEHEFRSRGRHDIDGRYYLLVERK
jgi:ubiquinone/menaquinone biosynthesis C-methylase UbiE